MKLRAFLGTTMSFAMVGLLAVACANSDDDDSAGGSADSGPATVRADSSTVTDSGTGTKTDSGTKADTGTFSVDAADDVNTGMAPDCDPSSLSITQIGAILGGSSGPCDSTCSATTSCCLDLTALFSGGGGLPVDAGLTGGGLCLPNM